MNKENLSGNIENIEPGVEAPKNPYEQMADEVGEFNPEQALQNVAEAKASQETEEPEPTIEVTREEIASGIELVLPKTSVADELLKEHQPKTHAGSFEQNKKSWNQRSFKLTQSEDERHLFAAREPVYGSSHGFHQSTDEAIESAVHNQLNYLDRKMNGYYDGHSSVEEEELGRLRGDMDAVLARPGHKANTAAVESVVNERVRAAKLQAVSELYDKANVVEKWQLKKAGIEDEIQALRDFNFDDFKDAEKEAEKRAQHEAENVFAPGAANAANAIQDTLDKIGGEVHSPDIIPEGEQSPDGTATPDASEAPEASETQPKLSAEEVSATTIDQLHQLAQTHSKEELLDRIYAEDWVNNYDTIVQELFDGNYGLPTQAAIVDHMSREELSHNLDKMLDNGTFDGYIIIKKMEQSGHLITPEEAYIFRKYGYNDIADSHEK